MTRKHFREAVAIIRAEYKSTKARERAARCFIELFRAHNPRYDKRLFMYEVTK